MLYQISSKKPIHAIEVVVFLEGLGVQYKVDAKETTDEVPEENEAITSDFELKDMERDLTVSGQIAALVYLAEKR